MKNFIFLICLSILSVLSCFAQYDGAVGTEGCLAISKDDSRITSWAKGCQVTRGYQDIAIPENGVVSFGTIQNVLNTASEDATDAISFGDGGYAVLTFDRPIINGSGYDFAIFENSFNDFFLELAFVEVSSDGEHYIRFPAVSLTNAETQIGTFGSLDPTKLHNLAGKYRIGWGTPFDLEDLQDSSNIDLMNIRFIKIIDVIGSINQNYATYDALGNIINDPYPTDFYSGGFDLTGVAVINGGTPYIVSDLSNFLTTSDTTLLPDANSGIPDSEGMIYSFFSTGIFNFNNSYSTAYGGLYNDGFVISNMQNDTVQNYDHSAITVGGMEGPGSTYLSAFYAGYGINRCVIELNDTIARKIEGLYITNSTTSVISMQNGDFLAKKFGGISGTDPDWFKITAIGYNGDTETERAEFYLADFRSSISSEDYIVSDWRWFELAPLGEITKVEFVLSSSDTGDYGMNTPAYFCMDMITVRGSTEDTSSIQKIPSPDIKVYPNPCSDFVTVANCKNSSLQLYNSFGQKIYEQPVSEEQTRINMNGYSSGIYIIRIQNKKYNRGIKIIKK